MPSLRYIASLLRVGFFVWMIAVTVSWPISARATASCAGQGYPRNAVVFDVREFGAKGDGLTDDTKAFQAALTAQVRGMPQGIRRGEIRIVYVPDGVYRVSDTLNWRTPNQRYLVLQGQSRNRTIIKLADAAVGFNDTSRPKAVVSTLRGRSNLRDSFRNSLYDLTIDTGASNPGAIALEYMNNNTGGIGNVTLRSSDPSRVGVTGLSLTQEAHGPSLIKNLAIEGFDVGIDADHDEFNSVLEHVTLRGQRKVGIRNRQFILTISDLISENSVTAIESEGESALVQVIGGRLSGGIPSNTAITLKGGFAYLKDVAFSGYGSSLRDGDKTDNRPVINEYASASFRGSGDGSLGLPVKEVPEVACEPPDQWLSITEFGAISGDSRKPPYSGRWTNSGDDSVAIQKAIDFGSSTVYFPNGVWQIGQTIVIRGSVRRLMLLNSTLQLTAAFAASGDPIFRIEDGTEPVIVLEQFETDYGPKSGAFIEHASGRTLVLRQAAVNLTLSGHGYITGEGGKGDVFLEDVTMSSIAIKSQQAWLRQFNPEGNGPAHLVNDGGSVWVLGMKTEGVATIAETLNSGKTEIIGALLGSSDYVPPDLPAFVDQDSHVSVIAATGNDPAAQHELVVRQIRGGKLSEVRSTQFRSRARHMLYKWNGNYGPSGSFWIYSSR